MIDSDWETYLLNTLIMKTRPGMIAHEYKTAHEGIIMHQ